MAATPLRALVPLAVLALLGHAHAQGSSPRPATVAAIALSIRSRADIYGIYGKAIQDSRCYLMSGGAVESFFISEDTPVGSIIGTLSVNGDASETGDITLRLQEPAAAAAVGVAPRSKNLTLLRPLDRERQRGPAAAYVNVRCDRRRSTDPSFIIPVSVRVWDENDNAPQWEGAPYRVRVSELAAVGTVLLRPLARDADQPGPHATVAYSVLPDPQGFHEYLGFANELDNALVVKKPLDYEAVRNFSITLRAQDQGSPPRRNDTRLLVEVLDADDQNPKFTHDHYTAVIPRDAEIGSYLTTQPGPIHAADQDLGINAPLQYSAAGGGGGPAARVGRDSGRLQLSAELRRVAAAQPATLVVKATQVDNPDRYALATVTVTAEGAPPSPTPDAASSPPPEDIPSSPAPGPPPTDGGPVRFTRRAYSALVREDTAPGATLLALHTTPRAEGLQFYVSDRSFLEKFAINGAGELLLRRPLDFETARGYLYQVMVTDGVSNDTASINISVGDVNEWEPRFRHARYEFSAEAAGRVGRLLVHDGDAGDAVSLALSGPDARMLEVNEQGEVFLRSEALRALTAPVLHALATATDSGTPPRQTSVPVLVHVAPQLLASGTAEPSGAGSALGAAAGAAGLLALLAGGLLLYIYRTKRRSKAVVQNKVSSGFVRHEKSSSGAGADGGVGPASLGAVPASGGAGPASGGAAPALGGAGSGSLLSVSAGASTILANSTSSLDLRADANHNLSPHHHGASSGRASQRNKAASAERAHLSDHVSSPAGGRSGVAWPAHTIPARVTQLSWDRAQGSGEEGPVTDATNTALNDHMNLTVYF